MIKLETISQNSLIGLVLAAGESKRMKTDKAFLTYHHLPQYLHAANMLSEFCDKTLISGKSIQYTNEFEVIVDDRSFQNNGPMGGVLTALNQYPTASFFILGVDYPFLQHHNLETLYQNFKTCQKSVCFRHPVSKIIEPLIAIYHRSDLSSLQNFYNQKQTSMQHFLSQINPLILETATAKELTSVDEPL